MVDCIFFTPPRAAIPSLDSALHISLLSSFPPYRDAPLYYIPRYNSGIYIQLYCVYNLCVCMYVLFSSIRKKKKKNSCIGGWGYSIEYPEGRKRISSAFDRRRERESLEFSEETLDTHPDDCVPSVSSSLDSCFFLSTIFSGLYSRFFFFFFFHNEFICVCLSTLGWVFFFHS